MPAHVRLGLGLLVLLLHALACAARSPNTLLASIVASDHEQLAHDSADPKPKVSEYAAMSRWLTHETDWGTLATLDKESGTPVAGVLAHADGPNGRLFFYLTPKDELSKNFMVDPRVSFTVSEAQIEPKGCHGINPMDPRCARASVLGSIAAVTDEQERNIAQAAVFTRHPDMAAWPADHHFDFFELHVKDIHLLDWYGGMHFVGPDEYYSANVTFSAAAFHSKLRLSTPTSVPS